jgi:hypothetical protein
MKTENSRNKQIDLNKIQVSFYTCLEDTTSKEVMTLNRYFGQHAKLDEVVCKIRAISDKKERDALKCTLPGITPSGIFRTRKDSEITKHSGLIALDFDNLSDSVDDVKDYISTLPYIFYCGLSASGRGLWALVPIGDPTQHRAHFKSLQSDFAEIGLTVDPTGINESRFRFYSYDDSAHFNLRPEIYTRTFKEPLKNKPQYNHSNTTIDGNIHLNRLVNLILKAPDGLKHFTLYRVARTAGGYVSSNTLRANEAIDALEKAISQREVKSLSDAYKTIQDGFKLGLNSPIF